MLIKKSTMLVLCQYGVSTDRETHLYHLLYYIRWYRCILHPSPEKTSIVLT